MAGMADRGAMACVMECSSIGLDQGRVDLVDFDVAIFTNLGRDHLDYHEDSAIQLTCVRDSQTDVGMCTVRVAAAVCYMCYFEFRLVHASVRFRCHVGGSSMCAAISFVWLAC